MSQRLTETLKTFQSTLDPANMEILAKQVAKLSRETQAHGEALIDFAFRKILLLIGLAALIIFSTSLMYQWAVKKIRAA